MTIPRVIVVLAVLASFSCAGPQSFHTHVVFVEPGARGAPGQLWPLRAGQLVLSEAPGPHSLLFGLGTVDFYPFTHAALLTIDAASGEAQVIDTAAEYKPRFARSPADALDGGPRRQPFLTYVAANLYVEVIEPPAALDRTHMAARLDELWRQRVPFDAHWDLSEHERLFCTEFVADVLQAGGAQPVAPVPITANPSLLAALRWFGVRGDVSLPAAVLAGPAPHRVAAFSAWRHPGAARAYFEAKRELHRRFTLDQKIGNVLELTGTDVRTRPAVQAFLDRAVALHDNPDAPDVVQLRQAVRTLADQMLGPFPVAAP